MIFYNFHLAVGVGFWSDIDCHGPVVKGFALEVEESAMLEG